MTALSPTQSTSAASQQETVIRRDQPDERGQKMAAEGLGKVLHDSLSVGGLSEMLAVPQCAHAAVRLHQSPSNPKLAN